MPRQSRINYPGALHHLMVRGLEGKEIFKDTRDRREFLDKLENLLCKSGTECHAWSLLPNHTHFLVRTSDRPLSSLMKGLLAGYAQYFNRRHKRRGYLFQNRFKSVLCQEEEYYLALVRYIHLNPLRAGLVRNLAKLGDYSWCGHSVLIGRKKRDWQKTDEVLAHFANRRSTAISKYKEFVREGIQLGRQEHLTGGGLRRSAGGWTEVLKLRENKEYWRRDDRILGDGDFVEKVLKDAEERLEQKEDLKKQGWDLERLAERVCELFSVEKGDLQKKGRRNSLSDAKCVICHWGTDKLGKSGREVAYYLGISQPAVSQNNQKGRAISAELSLNLLS